MRRRTWMILGAGILLIILLLAGANFFMDLLWFKELKAEQVWWTRITAGGGLRVIAWLLLFLFFYVNLLATRRHLFPIPNIKIREILMARGITDQLPAG